MKRIPIADHEITGSGVSCTQGAYISSKDFILCGVGEPMEIDRPETAKHPRVIPCMAMLVTSAFFPSMILQSSQAVEAIAGTSHRLLSSAAIEQPHAYKSRSYWTVQWPGVPSTQAYGHQIIDTYDLDHVCDLFEFRRPQEVLEFLGQNPGLLPLLIEARPHVERHFGAGTAVVLEVVRDPEISGSEQLVAYIQSNRPVGEAIKCLDALDEAWWLETSSSADNKLCLHVE